MAKNDLIGGALWEQYSAKVGERMNNPRYRGEISEEEAKAMGARLVVADWGAEACGDAVRLYWAVDPKNRPHPAGEDSRASAAARPSPHRT